LYHELMKLSYGKLSKSWPKLESSDRAKKRQSTLKYKLFTHTNMLTRTLSIWKINRWRKSSKASYSSFINSQGLFFIQIKMELSCGLFWLSANFIWLACNLAVKVEKLRSLFDSLKHKIIWSFMLCHIKHMHVIQNKSKY